MKKLLLTLTLLLGSSALWGQAANGTQSAEKVDWYAQLDNPQNPGNFLEKVSQDEAISKMNTSHNYAIEIFNALKSNNRSGIEQFVPTFEDAVSFMSVAYWSNEKARKQTLKDLEGWHIDMVNRINDSFHNVITDAKQQGFDWATAEITEVDNKFKKNSQFAGGEVKIYAKDANNNTYMVRMSSLFEVEGKWMMTNQFIIR